MIPRMVRTLLLVTTLGLLLLPAAGTASANNPQDPDLVGEVTAGQAVSCAPEGNVSHERCVGGSFSDLQVRLTAKRADNSATATCVGNVDDVPFSTRETVAEGRGRVGPIHVVLQEDAPVAPQECRVRLEGRFHRIGTVAIGRLTLDVHRADGTFRHTYCARFDATAVPVPTVATLVVAAVEGYENPACAGSDPDTDGTHGRRPDDGHDPLHHDLCVDQVTHSCTHLTPTRVL